MVAWRWWFLRFVCDTLADHIAIVALELEKTIMDLKGSQVVRFGHVGNSVNRQQLGFGSSRTRCP